MSNLPTSSENRRFLIIAVTHSPPLFTLGHVVATPDALDLLDRLGINASTLLVRHQQGDWGDICREDAATNTWAAQAGERLLSAYILGKPHERLWIITERDRSVTTLLLPEEY
ncbi:hypothetical protein BCF11_3354 [Collimonas sp. PA-H2]|uniref:hypothetical protein n=1 Tax=Collimonas sp. PA-H2 TaxID=1881062 RepID=UPI000C0140E1|nr:hypothetical protein [Collimonas sp. PA-H2]PFH10919.1 hypothetical protein BCF11_3354 [Collimonas sp. PA-H2]